MPLPRWSRFPAACIALVLLTACGGTTASQGQQAYPASAPRPARLPAVKLVTETKAITEMPVYVAVDKGFFRQAGIQVDLVEFGNAAPAIEAIHSGDVQFLAAGTVNFLRSIQKNMQLVAVAGYMDRAVDELTIRSDVLGRLGVQPGNPLPKRLAALKGRTLGIEAIGGIVDGLTRYLVRQAGLSPTRDVRLVAFEGAPAMVAAMQHGQIDGFLSALPWPRQTEQDGFGTVLISGPKGDVAAWNNLTENEVVTTAPYASSHADVVRAVADGIAAANDYVRTHPEETLAVARERFPKIQPDVLAASVRQIAASVPEGGRMSDASWQAAQDLWLKAGILKQAVDLKQVWTNQYLPQ